MKKHLFSILALSCMFSCGVISYKASPNVAKATTDVDLGSVTFSLLPSQTTFSTGIFLISDESNEFHYVPSGGDWTDEYRMAASDSSNVLLNGTSIVNDRLTLVKHGEKDYFLTLADANYGTRNTNDVVTIQGNWTKTIGDNVYSLNVSPCRFIWNGAKWSQEFVVPELEPYEKVSLVQASYPDYDRVAITNAESVASQWNTFATENEYNDFSFEFAFESYASMTDTLNIRIGSSGSWDQGHPYQISLNNTWNEVAGGVIVVYEKSGSTVEWKTGDLPCYLKPGARHIIEFGSVHLKDDSSKVYNFVKYDGEFLFQRVRTPAHDDRTSRVAFHYPGTEIFLGSSMSQRENVDELTFNRSNFDEGIYLDGPTNDIPVENWDVRGAPASKYNVLKNGQPIFSYGNQTPLVKYGSDDYYLVFSDYGVQFVEGDVISLSGEFHFYKSGKAYSMAVKPINFLFSNGEFSLISNINSFLLERLNNQCYLEDYDDDKVLVIEGILEDAASNINTPTSMKDLWDLYFDYVDQLDAVPLNEEKARERLEATKQIAIAELNSYVDPSLYLEADYEIIEGYIAAATTAINAATSVGEVQSALNNALEQIDSVKTKQQAIEEKIIGLTGGYEEYLDAYDVVTTTDLSATGDLKFYSLDSENESFGTGSDHPNVIKAVVPTKAENTSGNMIFQFKYKSSKPTSNKYGSQVYLRVRGTGSNCYMFYIGTSVESGIGVGASSFLDNVIVPKTAQYYNANFQANEEYAIECGAIDLKEYNRTFLFIKVDSEYVVKEIVDSIDSATFATAPSIIIMDSHLKDGDVDDVTTLSPIEEGTTKGENATLLGRPVLNQSSNHSSLEVSLRKNNIPNNESLYPLEKNSFTLNGQEFASHASNPILTKINDTKYSVQFKNVTFEDGDVVHIGGNFAYFDTDSFVKTVYRLFDATFTYHASSDSWSEEEATVDVAKYEAKATLSSYANLSEYTEANQTIIEGYVEEYATKIDNASSTQEVNSLLDEALGKIDGVLTIFGEYKKAAKEELANYKSPSIYRDEEKAELNSILSEAYAQIDACTDKDSVDAVVALAKSEINTLKTDEQYSAEELASYKKTAKGEIESFVGSIDLSHYDDEGINEINRLALKARNDIDAANSQQEIDNIVSTFKAAVRNIKTIDGTVIDDGGEVTPAKKKGCKSSIVITSSLVSITSLIGVALLTLKKKED